MQINNFSSKKGSSPAEVGLISAGVFLVGFFSISLFGDNIADFFQNKDKLALFKGNPNRAIIPAANSNLLTNIDLTLNNQSLKTPIETYIRTTAGGGKLVETNGSAGNMKNLAYIAKEYSSQIQEVIKANNINTSALDNALKLFNDNIDSYIAKDQMIVSGQNDPLLKIINDLDIAIDLNKKGDIAKNLSIELAKVLEQLPVGSEKTLLEAYSKDLFKMGNNIDYHVDSRDYEYFQKLMEKYLGFSELGNSEAEDNTSSTNETTDPVESENNSSASETENSITVTKDDLKQVHNIATTLTESILDRDGRIDLSDLYDSIQEGLDENDYFDGSIELDEDENDGYRLPKVYRPNGQLESDNYFDEGYFELENGQKLYLGSDNSDNNLLWIKTKDSNSETTVIGENIFGFLVKKYEIVPLGSEGDGFENTCQTSGWGCTKEYYTQLVENPTPNTEVVETETADNAIEVKTSNTNITLSKYDKLVALKKTLQAVNDDTSISNSEKIELANKVNVYLDGTFSEVFEGSYNNIALCNTLKGNIVNNACAISDSLTQTVTQANVNVATDDSSEDKTTSNNYNIDISIKYKSGDDDDEYDD